MRKERAEGEKWNRTSIQFTEEEYDRLMKERYETRKPLAQIIRDALNLYFDAKKKPRCKKQE